MLKILIIILFSLILAGSTVFYVYLLTHPTWLHIKIITFTSVIKFVLPLCLVFVMVIFLSTFVLVTYSTSGSIANCNHQIIQSTEVANTDTHIIKETKLTDARHYYKHNRNKMLYNTKVNQIDKQINRHPIKNLALITKFSDYKYIFR